DDALRRASARRGLELGTYCGYSSLRMTVAAPAAKIISVEFSAANAEIARRIHAHAGGSGRGAGGVGTLGDGGTTLRRLRDEQGLAAGSVDLVFLDHAKEAYLPDLERILDQKWLRAGGLAVADNMKLPGSPAYLAYMKSQEGKLWRTTE